MRAGYGQVSPRRPRHEQEDELWRAGCIRIFFDEKDDAKQTGLDDAIALLAAHAGRNDPAQLVVTSLDRLGSSIARLTEIAAQLREKRILLLPLHENWTEQMARSFLSLMPDVARYQRENALDKTQRGVLVAEKRGLQTGPRPKLNEAQLKGAIKKLKTGASVASVAAELKVSVPTMYRYLAGHNRGK